MRRGRDRGPARGGRTPRRWCCPATAPSTTRWTNLGRARAARSAARVPSTSDRPFLGICLGYQLLFTESEEFGQGKGLDVIPGAVRRFPAGLKVPHMGWNQVEHRGDLRALRRHPERRALLLRALVLPGTADAVAVAVATCTYGVDVRRRGRARRAVRARSSTPRRASAGACGCSRTSPPSCADRRARDRGFDDHPGRSTCRAAAACACARGAPRPRPCSRRRPGGHGARAGRRGRAPAARRRPRRRLRRAARQTDDRRAPSSPRVAIPVAGGRRAARRSTHVERGARRGRALGDRGHARPRSIPTFLGEVCARFADGSSSAIDASDGGSRSTAGSACSTSTPPTLARDAAAAGAAAHHLHGHRAATARRTGPNVWSTEAVARAAGIPRDRLGRRRLARRHPRSSRRVAGVGGRHRRAARSTRGAVDLRAPRSPRRRRRDARQAPHPLPRRKDGRVVKGVRFVDLRDAGDPGRGGAGLRRAGRRRARLPRHHRVARGPRHHAGRGARGPPRASSCRSPWAAACAARGHPHAAARGRRQGLAQHRGAGAPRAGRARRRARFGSQCIVVAIDAKREPARPARALGRLHARRPPARGPRRRGVGARGRSARRGRDPADEHGPRRHRRRLRPRAHPRGVRGGVGAGDRLGRRRHASSISSRASPRARPTRRSWPRSSTSAGTPSREAKALSARARRAGAARAVSVEAELRWDARRAHPRRGPGDRDRRGADGRLDEPGGARGDARARAAAISGPARGRRSGGRARRPATSSTWTASMPTATATRCWCRCTRRAWPATPARAPASSRRAGRRAAAPARGRRGPGDARGARARAPVARGSSAAAGSYVAGLLAKGEAQICRKIGEEATEVVTAALGGEGDERVVSEVADLWFHTMVLLDEPRHPPAPRLRRAGASPRRRLGPRRRLAVRPAA